MVDNYGPRVPLGGGGVFSGKDGTKVDRSAAYMQEEYSRLIRRKDFYRRYLYNCFYAIGYDKPLQSAVIDGKHESIKGYDLTPKGIIDFLELKTPIYSQTSTIWTYGM